MQQALRLSFALSALGLTSGFSQNLRHWAGSALNPAFGGNGNWNQTDAHWSTEEGSYQPALWANGAFLTAVLGGNSAGIITLTSHGMSGTELIVRQNHTINGGGHLLSFGTVKFEGAGTNLTVLNTNLQTGMSAGTLTLEGNTLMTLGGSGNVGGGTLIARGSSALQGHSLGGNTGTAHVEFHDSASLLVIRDLGLGSVSSGSPGAGIITGQAGIRESVLTLYQPVGERTYTGAMQGALNINKDGPGTWVLGGVPKTYTGRTTVMAGTLRLAAPNVIPSVSRVMVGTFGEATLDLAGHAQTLGDLNSWSNAGRIQLGGATLTLSGTGAFAGVIAGAGNVVRNGTGMQMFSGPNTYSGATVVHAGSLGAANATAFGTGPVTFKAGTTLGIGASNIFAKDIHFESGTVTIDPGTVGGTRGLSGVLSGNATLHYVGDAWYSITGNNTYTGGTQITRGVLGMKSDAALGQVNGGLKLSGGAGLRWLGSFTMSATRSVEIDGEIAIYLEEMLAGIAGPISGTGAIRITGPGGLTLSGTNTFEGGIEIGSGSLVFTSDAALGLPSGPLTVGLAALRFPQSMTFNPARPLRLSYDYATFYVDQNVTVTVPNEIGLAPQVNKAGLTKDGRGTLVLSGASTYNGTTAVFGGTLRLTGGANRLPANQELALDPFTDVVLDQVVQEVSILSGFGRVILNAAELSISADCFFGGVIEGTGTIRKTGTGVLRLWQDPSFNGVLRVDGGMYWSERTLSANIETQVAMGGIVAGSGQLGKLRVESGGVVAPGAPVDPLRATQVSISGGSHYLAQIRNLNAGPGAGWAVLVASTGAHLTATPENPLTVHLVTTAANGEAGLADGFDPALPRNLTILNAGAGITGYVPGSVVVSAEGFLNPHGGDFIVELMNNGGDLMLRYLPPSRANWNLVHFSEAERATALISGPQADADGDGLPNLLEYALGLDPRNGREVNLPRLQNDAEYWEYFYTRASDRTDVTCFVEVSADLQSWSSSGIVHEKITQDGATRTETWRARFPKEGNPSIFMRLRVEPLP